METHWDHLSDDDLVRNTAEALDILARGLSGRSDLMGLQKRIVILANEMRRTCVPH